MVTAWRSSTSISWLNSVSTRARLGVIFRKAQNKIQDPAKLKRLVSDLIDREQWMILDADVKGDAYEGLLAKNARREDRRRPVLHSAPAHPGDRGRDAAHGVHTGVRPGMWHGGFLLAAYEQMKSGSLTQTRRDSSGTSARGWKSSTRPPGFAP